MRKRQFKKAARKAWLIAQEQPSARLTWREAQALERFAKAHPELTVKHWDLMKDPRPRYLQTPVALPKPRPRPNVWTSNVATAHLLMNINFVT